MNKSLLNVETEPHECGVEGGVILSESFLFASVFGVKMGDEKPLSFKIGESEEDLQCLVLTLWEVSKWLVEGEEDVLCDLKEFMMEAFERGVAILLLTCKK